MPVYEYSCENCGGLFEVNRPMNDRDNPLQCVYCSSKKIKRSLSIVFAHNEQGNLTNSKRDCSDCSGGSCSTCGT